MKARGLYQRLQSPAAALVLLAAAAVCFRHFWWPWGRPDLALFGDFVRQFYPWRAWASSELFAGRLPLWDPFTGCGVDFLARLETAVFYPPNLALPWLVGGDLSFFACQLFTLLHLPLYGLCTYALLRGVGAAWPAALLGGLAALGDGFLRAWLGAAALPQAVVWLPLAALCLWRLIQRPDGAWAVYGAAALATSLLGGMTQLTLYAGVGLILMWLVWCAPLWRRPDYPRWRALGWSGAMAGLAAGLAAAQLLPTLGLTQDSARLTNDLAFMLGGSSTPAVVLGRALQPSAFLGTLPAGLALAALCGRGGRLAWGLGAAGLWAALYAMGEHGFLAPFMVRHLPGFGLFREPERALFLLFLAEYALAGLGLDWLMRPPSRGEGAWRRWPPAAALAVCGAAAVAVGAGAWSLWPWALLAACCLMRGAIPPMAGLAARWPGALGWTAAGLALAATLLWGDGPPGAATYPPEGYYAETPQTAWLKRQQTLSAPFRVGGQGYLTSYPGWRDDPGTWPRVASAALVHRIPTIDAAGQLVDRRLAQLYGLTRPNPRVYDLMNVLYEANDPQAPPPAGSKYAPPELPAGGRALYDLTGLFPAAVRQLVLVSRMAFARQVPQGATAAEIVLTGQDGRVWRLPVRAGLETAEWAVDKPGEPAAHRAAPPARSWEVRGEGYLGHSYLAMLDLPEPVRPARLEIVRQGPGTLQVEDLRLGGRSLYLVGPRWRLARRGLWRNRWALPRAFVVEEVLPAADEAAALGLMRTLEPALQAVTQGSLPPPAPGESAEGAAPEVRVLEERPGRVLLEAVLARPGLLVLGDALAPGWRARSGDRPLELVRADLMFRGVMLGAGRHRVEMTYANPWFQAGALLSVLSVALCSAVLWRTRRRRL